MTILQKIQPDRVPVTAQEQPSPSLLSTNGDAEQIPYAQMQTTSRRLLPYLIKIGLAALVVTGLILASLAIWYITHRCGAPILAELLGYALSADGYHPTAPEPEGRGAYRAIRAAINTAGLAPEDVDYVNGHGTGTTKNDSAETRTIRLALRQTH